LRWTAEGARSAKRACEPFTPFPVWRLTSWFLVTKIQMTVSIRNEDNFAGRNPRRPDERVSRKGGFVVWPREGRDCSQSTGPAARSGRSCGLVGPTSSVRQESVRPVRPDRRRPRSQLPGNSRPRPTAVCRRPGPSFRRPSAPTSGVV